VGRKNMKVYYHNGKDKCKCINTDPLVSYEELESGTIVMWQDKTINSLIDNMTECLVKNSS
jgi:hypothetical protein